ncbi:MAG: hypothetical protein V4541_02655 [Bacteroidota bacterium]
MIETEEDSKRWNFTPATIKKVQQRAAFICSNPKCRLMTVGPSLKDDDQVQYAGKVAHILPASKGGPRELTGTTSSQRQSMKNAIFLCSSCADIIDKNNGTKFFGTPEDYRRKVLFIYIEDFSFLEQFHNTAF